MTVIVDTPDTAATLVDLSSVRPSRSTSTTANTASRPKTSVALPASSLNRPRGQPCWSDLGCQPAGGRWLTEFASLDRVLNTFLIGPVVVATAPATGPASPFTVRPSRVRFETVRSDTDLPLALSLDPPMW